MGRDALIAGHRLVLEVFQSTRPRGARLAEMREQPAWRRVSIHAPAWGATVPWGSTDVKSDMFQSTRPRGARPRCLIHAAYHLCVSIHAPAWGATIIRINIDFQRQSFNPRARVGRDCSCCHLALSSMSFQSTRPRGARPGAQAALRRSSSFNPRARVGRDAQSGAGRRGTTGFNPRARVGRDAATWDEALPVTVSIHAPAWGATAMPLPVLPLAAWFQSTRPRGARLLGHRHASQHIRVSIHAPAWGATGCHFLGPRRDRGFNPRARVGRDGRIAKCLAVVRHVSIHAPAWGATSRYFCNSREAAVSIHAPAWGATYQGYRLSLAYRRVSIHAPAWGATIPSSLGLATNG